MTVNLERATPRMATPQRPYSPSWLNRLLNWIDTRPGPAWPYYLIGILLFGVIVFGATWMLDGGPVETVDTGPLFFTVYPVYFIALMHYLDGEARSALAKFRPALQVSDAEYARIEYELTTVPARGAWWVTAFAILFGFYDMFNGETLSLSQPTLIVGITIVALFTAFGIACFFILAFHTIRQLRMVNKIHASASTINLFEASPAYAFSQLTARTGIGLMLFAYFDFVLNPPDPTEPLTYLLMGTVLVVAVAAFVLPLLGMHQRLVQEKNKVEADINRGVETIHRKLQERMASENFANLEELDKTLSILLSLREVVVKIPTWPWQAETLRGFISALLIPILIWAFTEVLERYVLF
jgi:hypothetical protein